MSRTGQVLVWLRVAAFRASKRELLTWVKERSSRGRYLDTMQEQPCLDSTQPSSIRNRKVITLDVRDDILNGRHPFGKIMGAAAALKSDEELLIIAPIEPVPLFHVLGNQGFQHQSCLLESGDWGVSFRRTSNGSSAIRPASDSNVSADPSGISQGSIVEVDARGLEPPQPLLKILEALAGLPEGSHLHTRTDRRPMHLYPQLEERGFTAETKEQSDGSFLTEIRGR